MTKYTWDCKTVEVRPLENSETDVVYNVNWKVTGTSDVLDPNNTPYSATAIGEQIGTKLAIGSDQVSNIESYVQDIINNLITPTSVTLKIQD